MSAYAKICFEMNTFISAMYREEQKSVAQSIGL